MFLYSELHPASDFIPKMLERWPKYIDGFTMYRLTEEQWTTYFGPYGIHLFPEVSRAKYGNASTFISLFCSVDALHTLDISQQLVQHFKGMGGYSTIHGVLTTGTLYFVRDSAVVQKVLAAISRAIWAIYILLTYIGARPHSRFHPFVPSFFRGKK
ncbi:MAG: hypothetical protein M1823_005602 [Watsoniomyces obsoletus]|nr:MAG: hypothetical protein M1823_005602 [Watsoniomyces obsoletus]